MSSTLDYLRWRGDLSFKQDPFNSIDAALLASLVYLPADKSAQGHTLGEVATKLQHTANFAQQMHDATKTEVLLLPVSPRFSQLEILDWTNKVAKDPYPLQFTAATFRIDEQTIIIAYRGTDSSMIGWNEDMRMNYLPEIYGQNVASKYLTAIGEKFPHDRIFLTGHSKGGNFALYALSAVTPVLQNRVIKAYNFDGLGFFRKVFASPGFVRAMPKMKSYLPESSIFGAMLDHPEQTVIVKSPVAMRKQHNPRCWTIGRNSFTLAKGLKPNARIIRYALINFNASIPEMQRGETFASLFDAFENFDIDDVNQIINHKLLGTYRLGRVLLSLEPEERKLLTQLFTNIWHSYKDSVNLPLMTSSYNDYPDSNDSNKAPIFHEFYSPDQE